MRGERSAEHASSRVGDYSLAFGVVALVCAFVPVIGDFIAIPAAVGAIVLGFVGMDRDEKGRPSAGVSAIVGAFLGEGALLVVVMTLAATHLRP